MQSTEKLEEPMSVLLAERNETEVAEMQIDFERMAWTCAIHDVTIPLASGHDCPACLAEVHPPPITTAMRVAADNLTG